MKYLDKPTIIRIAACHTCCARRGEPCTFARCDDPHGKRMAAKQSHLDRIKRARKIWLEEHPPLNQIAAALEL